MSRFINTELKSDSELDSVSESKSDTDITVKLKSDSGSESVILLTLGKLGKNVI